MKPIRKLKKPDASSKLVLEEIIGLTAKNANGLASNINTSSCAYVAGCAVVVLNVDSCTQSHLVVSQRTPKPLTCVAVSRDGRFIAAGESGNQPAVLVWDSSSLAFVSELKGHLYGIECIAFSPDGEHLVSVGGYIYLWDWKSGTLVTKLKASSSSSVVTSVSFSSDAKFIVTAGRKHLKFWAIGSSPKTRLNTGAGSLAIQGKPANLGPQKGNTFVFVTSSIWSKRSSITAEQADDRFIVYALTDGGVLCLLDCGLSVRKSVELKVERGFALSASHKLVACACCNGLVRLYTSETLAYAGTLLYSKQRKVQAAEVGCHTGSNDKTSELVPALPDAIACQFSTPEKLVVVYADRTLYVWDIHEHDVNKATRVYTLVSHSACIWDVSNICCENLHDPVISCVARGCSGGISFATCSADGTIRLWDVALQPDLEKNDTDDDSLHGRPVGSTRLVSAGIFERDIVESDVSTLGFRSIAASSDGKYLAAGDCEGNLHIYNLLTYDYSCFQNVHDTEILSLSFSSSSNNHINCEKVNGNYFLASGGRDRIIHLYDVKRNFDLIESIDDHSAAVTSVKLTSHGHKILSCSADRSLVFRDVSVIDSGCKILRRHHQMASHGTVYDMALDPAMEFVVTVGQDKTLNTFDIASGKLTRTFKLDKNSGEPIKVTMDPSCSYLACSYSNKSMCIYDSSNGEMVTQSMGHGEVITGIIFLPDCKHVVSVGGDGCIFIWKLPARMSSNIMERVKGNFVPLPPKDVGLTIPFNRVMFCEEEDQQYRINPKDVFFLENSSQDGEKMLCQRGRSQRFSTFRFSISRLPRWAQDKVETSGIVSNVPDFSSSKLSIQNQLGQQMDLKGVSTMGGDGGECGSPFCLDPQTSTRLVAEETKSCYSSISRSSSDSHNSQSSPMAQETVNFAMDRRWINVYTVCPDLFHSAEVQHLTDTKMQVLTSSLPKVQIEAELQSEIELPFGKGCISDCSFHCCSMNDMSKCQNPVAAQIEENLHTSGSRKQGPTEVDTLLINSEDTDLFKKHFGSLPTTCKMERNKSLVRRKYFGQYVMQQDHPGYSKRLFETPVQVSGFKAFKYKGEAALHISSTNPAFHQDIDSSTQVIPQMVYSNAVSPDESAKFQLAESSAQDSDQRECIPEGSLLQQRITSCKEALQNLDSAAENVLHSFTELGYSSTSEEKLSDRPGASVYDEAGKLLPAIAKKLNAVAELVQCGNSSSCKRRRVEVSGFEPLLGTFAETVSQRVVEILKKNLGKD